MGTERTTSAPAPATSISVVFSTLIVSNKGGSPTIWTVRGSTVIALCQ